MPGPANFAVFACSAFAIAAFGPIVSASVGIAAFGPTFTPSVVPSSVSRHMPPDTDTGFGLLIVADGCPAARNETSVTTASMLRLYSLRFVCRFRQSEAHPRDDCCRGGNEQ